MPTYRHPGVYIEELPSGSRPIEGVATSVAAFIGAAARGPVGTAEPISNLDGYLENYGPISSQSDHMGFAVQQFYLNGGGAAYICRLVGEDSDTASAELLSLLTDANSGVLDVEASSDGTWANAYRMRVVKPAADALTFTLEIGVLKAGVFEAEETFAGLSMRSADPAYAVNVINDNSRLIRLVLAEDLTFQNATARSGALPTNAAYFSGADGVPDIPGPLTLALNINGLGTRQIALDRAALVLAADQDADGAAIAAAVQAAVRAVSTEPPYSTFTCTYDTAAARFVLTSPRANAADDNASVVVGGGSLLNLLRLDAAARASLLGGAVGTASDTFSGPLDTATLSLTLVVDNLPAITVSINGVALALVGGNAAGRDADGVTVARAVRDAVRAGNNAIPALANFDCTYEASTRQFTLRSGNGSPRFSGLSVSGGDLAPVMAIDTGTTLTLGREMDQGTAQRIPAHNGATPVALTGGVDSAPTAANYANFYNSVLRKVRDANVLLTPGQAWADDGSGNPIIAETLAHCEAMRDRMLIIDPPPSVELDQGTAVDALSLPTSTYSVLYYPWVQVLNPFFDPDKNPTAPRRLTAGPSAMAAGLWAKTDGKRGVWKAPAGVQTSLNGAAGLEFNVEDAEQDHLNPLGVNCLRALPRFGRVVWGSRTLSTNADPEWRYVPVRRTAIFIEKSIYEGIQWAVFEPNAHPLWSSLRANISNFMNGLFRAGAFQGETSDKAYFVRCALGDTMTQGDIDAGQVIVMVGFAPLKPAEFVIVRIQQIVGQE